MPEKFLPFTNPMDDHRRKIHPKDHDKIRKYYKIHKSQRQTAKHFGVSRRLVVFILNPERYEANKQRRKELKTWLIYHDRKQLTDCTRLLRARKRKMKLVIYEKRA